MPSSQADIRADITRRIIEALERGTVPWRKPWNSTPDPVRLPTNAVTERPYQGMNVILLWLAAQERGYPVNLWASYQQWRSAGAQVRKGEKATQIVFWRPVRKRVTVPGGEEKEESFPVLRTWSVFNIAQVEGEAVKAFLPQPGRPAEADDGHEEFKRFVRATGADIHFGLDRAAYHRPPDDFIVMPDEQRFISFPAFAETLAHELAHWSESRLGWTGSYAEGELRAELAACFVTSALGIPDSGDLENHAAYVGSWLRAMADDTRYIFRAASAASKAADYLMSFSRPTDEASAGVENEVEQADVDRNAPAESGCTA